ncbi:hypothetical protein BX659_10598 [Orenia metallireducens]|uniref:Uncharacterized protein n=1 Tax=Orenia metallireducens TaxID=1413210 RepID=A0A285G3Z4_9FIRM|nr:hypothetical protein BX659_10598 [Orenia metallireducens]SNY17151.1 hypothetical protein SAMN06265827_10498 [Orenia metallireducens]
MPDYCINTANKELFKVAIKEELPAQQLAVVTNKNIPFSIASQKFMELMVDI